jgi:hypothetical protein
VRAKRKSIAHHEYFRAFPDDNKKVEQKGGLVALVLATGG